MRAYLPLSILLLASACGQQPNREARQAQDLKTFDVEESAAADSTGRRAAASAPPGISVTAAPGVAFNYRYGFSLPADQVAGVQEQHAQACEALGIDQCRITGMHYRRVTQDDIEAMLAFKLAPAAARQFGKQGIEIVTKADGMLVESEISGEDAGAEIAAATRSEAQLNEELRRIEAQLARAGLPAAERAELQIQAQQLRESIRATRTGRTQRQESLARTPVVFRYGAGDYAPGFDTGAPMSSALERAGDNLVGGGAIMLLIVITLIPWLLLALLGWFGWRQLRRRFGRTSAPAAPPIED